MAVKETRQCPSCRTTHIKELASDTKGNRFFKCLNRDCGELWTSHHLLFDTKRTIVPESAYCHVCCDQGFEHGCPRCKKKITYGDSDVR